MTVLSEVRDKRTSQRNCHIPQLSVGMSRLGFSVKALPEVGRLGSGLAIAGWYTYSTSGPAIQRGILKEGLFTFYIFYFNEK